LVNLVIILLAVLLQIVAAGYAIRINREVGRPLAWVLISLALVAMAGRRLYVLVELLERGLPSPLLPNEVLGLVVSVLVLWGVVLIHGIFRSKAVQTAGLEKGRARARAEAENLKTVMAATPVPLWIAEDPLCQVVYGNPAAAALSRWPVEAQPPQPAPAGPQPCPLRLLRDGRELTAEEMPMQRAVLGGEEVRGVSLDLASEHGEMRHLTFYATALRDRAGRIQGGVCCAVDITELRHAQEALAKAQKMESLGMLAGGLAHDYNNIFQAMMANLEMAQATLPRDARGQPYLERLKVGLDRASRLSRDMLHSSGGDLRRPETTDLSSLVTTALRGMDAGVAQEFAQGLPPVMVDPLLVGRVVEGLVTNALEASPTRQGIAVRTYLRVVTSPDLASGYWAEPVPVGTHVVLEVADQGHGIDAASLPRIFDPFFSTRELGRGLGLAAVLGIVRGHRGGIQVESISGVGSAFRVYFPSLEGQEAVRTVPAEGLPTRNLVLLADDEEELRAVMAEMLQDWFGLEVVQASDGQEALEVFRQRPDAFDLVILDATMPRMGGVEAFEGMCQLRPGLAGVLCSGYALPDSRDQARGQGFADFLKKPFTSKELEALLERVLGVNLKQGVPAP
jgi:signal transduction histidine kinase/ActR/RegA family two-component response regulator